MRTLLLTTAALLAGTAATAQMSAPTVPPQPGAAATATQPAGPSAQPGAPAAAATASGPTVGATVYDAQGAEVGKIEAIEGQFATLATTKSKARLPLNAFGTSPKGPTLGMTAAEVDAAAGPQGAQSASAAPAAGAQSTTVAGPVKLTKGATVSDSAGAKVGTIGEVSGDFAVVDTGKNKVRLPLNAFADSGKGPVIGMTAAELDAAATSAAKPKTGR